MEFGNDGWWDSAGNWNDALGTSPPGFSGVNGDQASFSLAAGVNVDLGSTSPSVAAVGFNSGTTDYIIQSSSSGVLQLNNGGSDAAITVATGNQTIAAPVELASNTAVDVANSATLNIAGSMFGDGGRSLMIGNSANGGAVVDATTGPLWLSGSTEVVAGTLQIDGTWATSSLNVTAIGGGRGTGQLAGSGTIELTSGGLVYNSAAASTFAGNVVGDAGNIYLEVDGGSLILSGPIATWAARRSLPASSL